MLGPLPSGVVMASIFVILFALPVKLQSAQLKNLAFSIWMAGGIVMSYSGVVRLQQANLDTTWLIVAIALSAIIGIAKGKFVLSKTSDKNIERLDALTEPQRPIHVYSKRSWIMIGVMVLIALSLNILPVNLIVRGCVNVGIGLALVVSSLRYLQNKPSSASAL